MTQLAPSVLSTVDPLVGALELNHPIDDGVLEVAIDYREALQDQLAREIEAIKAARIRLARDRPES